MIEISYIEKGEKGSKKLECKCLTFLVETGEFKLYFYDNTQPIYIEPKYLTAISIDEPTVTTKEEFNGQIKTT